MSFQQYLATEQKLVYRTFLNSLKNNKLAHAYLIRGTTGSPLLECAKYLAKSLICDDLNPLACEECLTCIRFDEGNYADFILIDGSKQSIKVGDIEALEQFFVNTASEKKGKMIYIINHLENSNKEAINALLKFLEEPNDNVYGFITTVNEEKLLPTIISRLQVLTLIPIKKEEIIKSAKEKGVSGDDAEILSCLSSDINTLLLYLEDDLYLKTKNALIDTLDALNENKKEALFFVENELIGQLKSKEQLRLYFDLLGLAFKDLINLSYQLPLVLQSQEKVLKSLVGKLQNIELLYLEIMVKRSEIELNVNPGLLLEHIFIFIQQGGN